MPRYLALMRHGKAERPRDDQLDFDRALTSAGKRSLAATLPKSLSLWPDTVDSVEVWSSPATRTRQTADLLIQALASSSDIEPAFHIDENLWIQDRDSFLDSVRESPCDLVVAVGHNPFIEDCLSDLCGVDLHLATGGIALMELDPRGYTGTPGNPANFGNRNLGNTGSYRLAWIANGPVSSRWKTLITLEKRFDAAAHTLEERYTAFIDQPDDSETNHKLRVSIRTLRSLLAFCSPWIRKRQIKELQSTLKGIVRETSYLRELDVLCELIPEIAPSRDDLVFQCCELAAQERKRLYKLLSKKGVRKKITWIAGQCHSIMWKRSVEEHGLAAECVRKHFLDLAGALADDLATLDLADYERVHEDRKRAKLIRYVSEQFGEVVGPDAVETASSMKAMQDQLGRVCDDHVNRALMKSLFDYEMQQ